MTSFLPFYTGIWTDKKFRSLPNSDYVKVYLYLMFNPSMTLTGIYDISLEDTEYTMKLNGKFVEIFKEVVSGKYNIEFDSSYEKIWVRNRFKLIPTKSAKVIVGAIEELNNIEHPFKNKFIEKYKAVLEPFIYRLNGHEIKPEKMLEDDFIFNASKLYNSKHSLKEFLKNKGIAPEKIESVISRVLPNFK